MKKIQLTSSTFGCSPVGYVSTEIGGIFLRWRDEQSWHTTRQNSPQGTAEQHWGLKGVEGPPQLSVSSVRGQKSASVLDKTVKPTCKNNHRCHHCDGS